MKGSLISGYLTGFGVFERKNNLQVRLLSLLNDFYLDKCSTGHTLVISTLAVGFQTRYRFSER